MVPLQIPIKGVRKQNKVNWKQAYINYDNCKTQQLNQTRILVILNFHKLFMRLLQIQIRFIKSWFIGLFCNRQLKCNLRLWYTIHQKLQAAISINANHPENAPVIIADSDDTDSVASKPHTETCLIENSSKD